MYEVSTGGAAEQPIPPRREGVLLIGPPNVGKSAVFGALTRSYVTVSNYPGTTVEVTHGTAVLEGATTRVTDTPGVGSFLPTSEDERAARDMLLSGEYAAVAAVGDAKNLDRALSLALQLAEMEIPYLVCLNMVDEARERGIRVDADKLAERLGVEVVPTVAVRHRGISRLRGALGAGRPGRYRIEYDEAIERAIDRIEPLLPRATVAPRALALMVLAGDRTLIDWLRARVPAVSLTAIENVRQGLRRSFREPLSYVINRTRFAAARELAEQVSERESVRVSGSRALERYTIHPFWGVPILGLVLYGMYLFVGVLGAGTLVDWFESTLFGEWINPWVSGLAERAVPFAWLRELLVGEYGLVTMALTYALALILPIVGTFFLAFGVLEDSGYLPRLAVIVNRLFKRMGLNGKAVLPMVLGLGCDTMATLTTRILETRKERLIVTLLLALAIPCSAQLAVILAMLASMSAFAVGVWLFVVVGVIVLVGALASRVLPGRGSDFVLELPPLRVPRLKNILVKTLARIEWYLREAVPLFVLGTLVLFAVDRLGLLGRLEAVARPVVSGLLGLPQEAAAAFLVGFLRRDFGAAGLYDLARAGALDPIQIVVAVTTVTLFIPCIANFFVIVKERGLKTGLAVAAFVLPFALGVGAVLNAVLRTVPLPLG
jgi:ferrous iron transport protein B